MVIFQFVFWDCFLYKLPFIVDFPIENGDFPVRFLGLFFYINYQFIVDFPIENGDFPVRFLGLFFI